jgi:hypothetical protein
MYWKLCTLHIHYLHFGTSWESSSSSCYLYRRTVTYIQIQNSQCTPIYPSVHHAFSSCKLIMTVESTNTKVIHFRGKTPENFLLLQTYVSVNRFPSPIMLCKRREPKLAPFRRYGEILCRKILKQSVKTKRPIVVLLLGYEENIK